jgi:hypothetical protein
MTIAQSRGERGQKGDHLLLDLVGDGVGHLRPPPLSVAQEVGPVTLQQLPPG